MGSSVFQLLADAPNSELASKGTLEIMRFLAINPVSVEKVGQRKQAGWVGAELVTVCAWGLGLCNR